MRDRFYVGGTFLPPPIRGQLQKSPSWIELSAKKYIVENGLHFVVFYFNNQQTQGILVTFSKVFQRRRFLLTLVQYCIDSPTLARCYVRIFAAFENGSLQYQFSKHYVQYPEKSLSAKSNINPKRKVKNIFSERLSYRCFVKSDDNGFVSLYVISPFVCFFVTSLHNEHCCLNPHAEYKADAQLFITLVVFIRQVVSIF